MLYTIWEYIPGIYNIYTYIIRIRDKSVVKRNIRDTGSIPCNRYTR